MAKIDLGLSITAVNNASNSLKQVSGDVKLLGDNAQATSNRLKAIQVVIAGILLEKTIEWGKKLIETAAATQALELRMQSFTGSGVAAANVMEKLRNEFAATPYSVEAIGTAWLKLRAVVNDDNKVTSVIESVVNDVTAMGGKQENIDNLTTSFERMFAIGYVGAKDYKAILVQTGLTLGDLAKAAGTTADEMDRQLKQGFVKAATFADDFVKASNERFGFYAENLKNSVGGAYNLIFNNIENGFRHISETTNLNAHLTAIFQDLAGAITKVMDSINQKDIDSFFDWLHKIEPLMVNTVTAAFNIAKGILEVGLAIGTLLSKLTPEETEYGIIGYMLFGKKGFLVVAALDHVINKLPGAVSGAGDSFKNLQATAAAHGTNTYQALLDYNNQQNPGHEFNNMMQSIQDYVGGQIYSFFQGTGAAAAPYAKKAGGLVGAFLWGDDNKKGSGGDWNDPARLKAIQDALDNWAKNKPAAGGADHSSAAGDMLRAAADATAGLNDQLAQAIDKFNKLKLQVSGDELGGKLNAITSEQDNWNKQIDGAIKSELALKVQTAENLAIVAKLVALKAAIPALIDQAKRKEEELYAIQQKQFVGQQALEQMKNLFALNQLNITQNKGVLENIFLGTDGGTAILAFQQQHEQLAEQDLTLQGQIYDITMKIQSLGTADSTAPQRAALAATLATVQGLDKATQNAMQTMTIDATLQQELWKKVGQTLETDVADGIIGVLNGTQTLGDVARKVFSDMISMAIKYLIQLTLIKAASNFGGGAGGFLSFLGGFKDGGVFPGGITPFADGGVVQGPTMFGLAGEAGDEAILPLEKVGGKMGVRASGNGGGTTEFHFHSADPESNVKFFMANMHIIDAGLASRKRLNKSQQR